MSNPRLLLIKAYEESCGNVQSVESGRGSKQQLVSGKGMELKQRIKIIGGVLKNDEHAQCNFASFDNIAAPDKNGAFRVQKGKKVDVESNDGSPNARQGLGVKMETIRLANNADSIVDLGLDTGDLRRRRSIAYQNVNFGYTTLNQTQRHPNDAPQYPEVYETMKESQLDEMIQPTLQHEVYHQSPVSTPKLPKTADLKSELLSNIEPPSPEVPSRVTKGRN